ncbi:MAG: KEOPS complex subunit Pcc1 [Salinirussus sp.]
MAHVASLEFSYGSVELATRVERSLRPEIGDIEGDRATAALSRTDADLELRIEATDLVALRAGLNTWLSLATVAERAGTPEN